MKVYDHREETFQHGKFNLDDVSFIEQDEDDNSYVINLKTNDDRPFEEIHIFRSGCVIVPERNFQTMYIKIG